MHCLVGSVSFSYLFSLSHYTSWQRLQEHYLPVRPPPLSTAIRRRIPYPSASRVLRTNALANSFQNGLRTSLWTLYDAATSSSNEPFNASSLPMESSPAHMRHCIDLLRQSLMCRPDLTVEAKDDALGGVRGFGTEHQCVDWDGLVDWTRNWQTWRWQEGDGKGGGEHGHDHGGHGHGG